MTNLTLLVAAIQDVLQDEVYTEQKVVDRINDALQSIAAGIRMPTGEISPPLPDLYAWKTVNTSTTLPYISLPTDYQRHVFKLYDSAFNWMTPPHGGDYYSFAKFLKQINNLSLAETGSIYAVCIKGSKIYYQGIPSVSTQIGILYYRHPAVLALDGDVPEGIPDHLHTPLIKHWVCKEIMGEKIEAGVTEPAVGMTYHQNKFYEAMTNLVDFIGIDAGPQYYGEGNFIDAGICD